MSEPKWVTSFQMWSGLIVSLFFSMLVLKHFASSQGYTVMTAIYSLLGFYTHWGIWMVLAYLYNKFNDNS